MKKKSSTSRSETPAKKQESMPMAKRKNRKVTARKNHNTGKHPAPNFLVFYNGTERKEDSWVSYLSESYENLTGEPNLELKVLTLNINEGHNSQLLEQCQILREYAQYVAKVREYAGTTDLDTAVEQAVNDCIQNGILAEFLRKNKSEVIAMSIFEYDKEEKNESCEGRIRSRNKVGREAGIKVGIKVKNGLKVGREAGLKESENREGGIKSEIVQNIAGLKVGREIRSKYASGRETPEKIARYWL